MTAIDDGLANPARGFDFIFPRGVVQSFPAGARRPVMTALGSTGATCSGRPHLPPAGDTGYSVRVSHWLSPGSAARIAGVAIRTRLPSWIFPPSPGIFLGGAFPAPEKRVSETRA
jgi:hypothetical protein